MDQKRIRDAISEVFARLEPPTSDRLTSDLFDDSAVLRELLSFRPWWTLDGGTVDKCSDKISLLTSEAFHYYLPAFLLRSLAPFSPKNTTLEFTIYNLSPTKTEENDPWYSDRVSKFTPEQISVVRDFLSCILKDERMYNFFKDAERGMRKFWK